MISYAFAIVVAFSLDMLRFLFCNIATTISLVISKLDNIITTFQGDYIQTKLKSKGGEKMAEVKQILGSAMILFFLIIATANILMVASDFTRKYKKMKARAKRYERLVKMEGKLYV